MAFVLLVHEVGCVFSQPCVGAAALECYVVGEAVLLFQEGDDLAVLFEGLAL